MAKGKSASGSHTTSPNPTVASTPKISVIVTTPPPLAAVYSGPTLPELRRALVSRVYQAVAPQAQPNVNVKKLQNRANQFSLATHAPELKALICAKRAIRKEVLHALKRTKKGAGASRRRNHTSRVKC